MEDENIKAATAMSKRRPRQGEAFWGEMVTAWKARVLSHCRHVAGNAATIAGMKRTDLQQGEPANDAISYSGYRFPPE